MNTSNYINYDAIIDDVVSRKVDLAEALESFSRFNSPLTEELLRRLDARIKQRLASDEPTDTAKELVELLGAVREAATDLGD